MNGNRNSIATLLCTTSGSAALALALSTGVAQAEPWHFSLTPYMWATDLGVEAKLNDRQLVDETISVNDLLEDLDTIFQLRLEASKGEFGIATDLFDVTMSEDKSGIVLPQGAGTADLHSDIGMTIFDVAGVYDPHGDHDGIALLAGSRILNNRATVDGDFSTPGGPVSRTWDTSETLVDGLLGVRFVMRLPHRFGTQMQADVSTGGTDYTWSASPSLTYAFGKLGRFGVNAGYRRMEVAYKNTDGLDTRMTLSGFLLGLRTSF